MKKLTIELSKEDLDAVLHTPFTIGEMYETVQGRVYCSIARAFNQNNESLDIIVHRYEK